MRAYVLHDINKFRRDIAPDPLPSGREVLIKVKSAGICGSDIPRIYQTGAHVYPLIPGHEFSGEVIGLGPDADSQWQNKRVGIFPLIPCGACAQCRKQRYEMCERYSYLGSRRDGGFAEYVAVPQANLIELPEQVCFEEAAMLEPMAVAVHAMRRVRPENEDTLAVCGLGTIGLLLLMFLKEAGFRHIYAIGNKDFQRERVERMGIGAENYCDSRERDAVAWLLERTDGLGADVYFECVGKNETVSQAVKATAPAGRIALVGNPYSDMRFEKAVYWRLLRNQITVTGTWNSSFTHDGQDDWHYALRKLEQKRIRPAEIISHRYGFDEFERGFCVMRDKIEDYGKIMGMMG